MPSPDEEVDVEDEWVEDEVVPAAAVVSGVAVGLSVLNKVPLADVEVAVAEDDEDDEVTDRTFWSSSDKSAVALTQLLAFALKIHKTSSVLPPESTTCPSSDSAAA